MKKGKGDSQDIVKQLLTVPTSTVTQVIIIQERRYYIARDVTVSFKKNTNRVQVGLARYQNKLCTRDNEVGLYHISKFRVTNIKDGCH